MTEIVRRKSASMGEYIGDLRNASGFLQYGSIALAIVAGTTAAYFGQDLGGFAKPIIVLIIGLIGCGGVYLCNTAAFCSQRLRLYEQGLIVKCRDKVEHELRFGEMDQFSFVEDHRNSDGTYYGSTTKLSFRSIRDSKEVHCQMDFHASAPSASVMSRLKRSCRDAISERLAEELERRGSIAWTKTVDLTMDGIRFISASGKERFIPLMEIKACRATESELYVYREGDVSPALTIATRGVNFLPVLHLFSSLYNCYEKQAVTEEIFDDLENQKGEYHMSGKA